MPRYVGFLRAINVGGRVVKMDELREHFRAMKLGDVETFIASGNVLFTSRSADAAALEARIERELAKALGYTSEIFLRTHEELVAVIALTPFGGIEPDAPLHVGFLAQPPAAERIAAVRALNNDVDEFHFAGREVYWIARQGAGKTTVSGPRLAKALGAPTTFRNITTVRKLAEKTGDR